MPDLKNVKEYIRALEHTTAFLRSLLEEERRVTPRPESETERLSELTDLRMMTKSEIWPVAIDPELISSEDNENDKTIRADGILQEFMRVDLAGKRFLDYGCGDGSVANRATEYGTALSIGYDIREQGWNKYPSRQGFTLTTDLHDNEFDVVLLNDVLDHVRNESPVEFLLRVKTFKKLDATMHVRCHPWTSRHGTHLYRKLNKAYLQLVFDDQELAGLGLIGDKLVRTLNPIASYKQWFSEAGLQIVKQSTITQPVDAFFTTRPAIVRRIKEKFKESADPELAAGTKYPHDIMQVQFADFVLV